jgi:hypothetical protein
MDAPMWVCSAKSGYTKAVPDCYPAFLACYGTEVRNWFLNFSDVLYGFGGRFSTSMLEPKGRSKKCSTAQTLRVPLRASAQATVIIKGIALYDYGGRAFLLLNPYNFNVLQAFIHCARTSSVINRF